MMITYVGIERCDIVYYLLRIGKNLGKNVLAVDNSITGDLFHIHMKEDNSGVVKNGSVTVMRNRIVGKREAENYDLVVVYEGMNPEYSNYRDLTIFAPSENEAEWELEKPFVANRKGGELLCILRDRSTRKVNESVLSQFFDVEFDEIMEEEYGDVGYASYVALTHNHSAKIPRNGGIKSIVMNLATTIYKVDAKTLKKASR